MTHRIVEGNLALHLQPQTRRKSKPAESASMALTAKAISIAS